MSEKLSTLENYHRLSKLQREQLLGLWVSKEGGSRLLIELFEDSPWLSTRLFVLKALAKQADNRAFEFLARKAGDGNDPVLQGAALLHLASLQCPEALLFLEQRATHWQASDGTAILIAFSKIAQEPQLHLLFQICEKLQSLRHLEQDAENLTATLSLLWRAMSIQPQITWNWIKKHWNIQNNSHSIKELSCVWLQAPHTPLRPLENQEWITGLDSNDLEKYDLLIEHLESQSLDQAKISLNQISTLGFCLHDAHIRKEKWTQELKKALSKGKLHFKLRQRIWRLFCLWGFPHEIHHEAKEFLINTLNSQAENALSGETIEALKSALFVLKHESNNQLEPYFWKTFLTLELESPSLLCLIALKKIESIPRKIVLNKLTQESKYEKHSTRLLLKLLIAHPQLSLQEGLEFQIRSENEKHSYLSLIGIQQLLIKFPLQPLSEKSTARILVFCQSGDSHLSHLAKEVISIQEKNIEPKREAHNWEKIVKNQIDSADKFFQLAQSHDQSIDYSPLVFLVHKSLEITLYEKLGKQRLVPALSNKLAQFQKRILDLNLGSSFLKEPIVRSNLKITSLKIKIPLGKLTQLNQSILKSNLNENFDDVFDGLKSWALCILVYARNIGDQVALLKLKAGEDKDLLKFCENLSQYQDERNLFAHRQVLNDINRAKDLLERGKSLLRTCQTWLP